MVAEEYDWNEMSKHLILKVIIDEYYNKDEMAIKILYRNINEFENINSINGFSVFRDYILESLLWILKNNKELSPQNINNIISICKDIDKNLILSIRYIYTSHDYNLFLVETWLKAKVKPIEILKLHNNKIIENLASQMIELNWSFYFIQLLFTKIIESNQE